MIGRPKLVLASGSPRRVTLINQVGIEPDALRPAELDETPKRGELPRACANRLARAKAEAALESVRLDDELKGAYILAADTVVAVGRRILPKAELLDEAAQCLRLLSGRNHRVHTAVCLITPAEAFRRGGRDQGALQAALRRGYRGLSRLANGAARPVATPRRALPAASSSRSWLYSNVVGLPLYGPPRRCPARGYPIRSGWLNAM
jgi:septum formation protein